MKSITGKQLVDQFIRHLQENKNKVEHLASLWHGFEGWLKGELVLMLMEENGLQRTPWNDKDEPNSVGVEYKALLDPELLKGNDSAAKHRKNWSKQVDVWASSKLGANAPEHYIELKNVLCGLNEGKQIESFLEDLDTLRLIKHDEDQNQHPDEVVAILFGIGFPSQKEFLKAIKKRRDLRSDQGKRGSRMPGVVVEGANSSVRYYAVVDRPG